MLLFVLTILLIALLAATYVLLDREVIAPPIVYMVGFAACAAMACAFQEAWRFHLHWSTFSVILDGALVFCLVGLLIHHLMTKRAQSPRAARGETDNSIDIPVRKVLLVCYAVVQAVIIIWTLVAIAGMFPADSLASSIMQLNKKSTFSSTGVSFGTPLNQLRSFCVAGGYFMALLLAQELVEKRWRNVSLLAINFVLAIVLVMEMGSRTRAFSLLVVLAIAYLIIRYRNKNGSVSLTPKMLVIAVAVIVVVVAFFQVAAIGRNTSAYGFWEYLSIYVGGEIPNLDIYLQNPTVRDTDIFGYMTFVRTIRDIGLKFGIADFVYALDLPYHRMGGYSLGNVYTTYYAFIYDFGYVGAVVLTVVMAAISQFVYEKAMRGKGRFSWVWVFLYAFIAFQLLLCFFSNKFYEEVVSINLVRLLVYLAIVWVLYDVVPRFVESRREP